MHTLLAQFTDLHGVAKGKLVPLAHLDDVLTVGAGFSGPSIAGTGLPRTGPRSEYMARGAASTAHAAALDAGRGAHRGDGFVAGEPFDACPRQVLKRAVARLAERGWTLHDRHRARVLPAASSGRAAGCRPTTPTAWTSPATT